MAASSAGRHGRPAVLLSCWALGAKPENLLVASQPYFIGKVFLSDIVFMVPFR